MRKIVLETFNGSATKERKKNHDKICLVWCLNVQLNETFKCKEPHENKRKHHGLFHYDIGNMALVPCVASCSLVCWLIDKNRWLFCISCSTSLNWSFSRPATLVLSHSPRFFHRQSISWVLICSSCSTEQPLVCCVNWMRSCSTYSWSMIRRGSCSSLFNSDLMSDGCPGCFVKASAAVADRCCRLLLCAFIRGCDWLPFAWPLWENGYSKNTRISHLIFERYFTCCLPCWVSGRCSSWDIRSG